MTNKSQLYFIKGDDPALTESLDYFTPDDATYPAGSPAVPVGVNNHPLVAFLAATNGYVDFAGVLPPSGIVRLFLYWIANVNVGNVNWAVSWERDDAAGVDLAVDAFAAAKTVVSGAPAAVNTLRAAFIDFTSAEMGGLLPSEPYRLRVRRNAGVAPDTMVGDARLFRVILGEP